MIHQKLTELEYRNRNYKMKNELYQGTTPSWMTQPVNTGLDNLPVQEVVEDAPKPSFMEPPKRVKKNKPSSMLVPDEPIQTELTKLGDAKRSEAELRAEEVVVEPEDLALTKATEEGIKVIIYETNKILTNLSSGREDGNRVTLVGEFYARLAKRLKSHGLHVLVGHFLTLADEVIRDENAAETSNSAIIKNVSIAFHEAVESN